MFEDTFNAQKKLIHFCMPVSKIKPVEIIPDNKRTYDKCLNVLKAFFTKGVGRRPPLKGFLFEGVPGTGKTELVRQIARGVIDIEPTSRFKTTDDKEAYQIAMGKSKTDSYNKGCERFFLFIDGATIATPKWGDAESTLQAVFSFHNFLEEGASEYGKIANPRVIVLFDDIESLMLARTSEIAKEWHYSINAVLFHELDKVDASKMFVFATTNKPELVDDALRDRLYSIKFKPPKRESLLEIAKRLLWDAGVSERMQVEILKAVEEKLKEKKLPTIRDMEREVIVQCVERKAW